MDTKENLGLITRSLHWVIAICFIALISVGSYIANTETWALYSLHKSMGIILFVVILLRVGWRIKQGWPTPAGEYQKIEQLMAKVTHWVLLLGSMAMPITGMLYSGMGGHGFGIFGWTIVKGNYDPANPGQVIPYSELLSAFGEQAHEIIGYTLAVAIVLHIAGACKHHLVDKDRTLLRMLGK
jgi:cytochrome b561